MFRLTMIAAFLCAGAANAASVTQVLNFSTADGTMTYAPGSVGLRAARDDGAIFVDDPTSSSSFVVDLIPDFDPSLGTLEQVDITIDYSVGFSAFVAVDSTQPGQTAFADTEITINHRVFVGNANLPGTPLGGAFVDEIIKTQTVSASCVAEVDSTCSARTDIVVEPDAPQSYSFTGVDATRFVGTPGFRFGVLPQLELTRAETDALGYRLTSITQPRDNSNPVIAPFSGTVEVRYTYSPPDIAPIPLPASGFLLLAGLGGLALARRLRG